MIEYFVKHPVTTTMFVLVFVVLGVVAMVDLPIEKTPKIEFPIVTITVEFPGATPLEVETLVVKKIEDAVSELSEIEKIQSRSYDNLGFIFVEFLMSADVNIKLIEVKDKVEAILNNLPEGIERPVVAKFDPLIEPVMELVLSSDTLDTRTLYEYADKTLKTRLAAVEGVSKVDVYGGKERQINVRLDPLLMKQHYITIAEIIAAIQAKNTNVPGGLLEKDRSSVSMRFVGEFQNVDEIADMLLTAQDGKTFPLKEIGTIEDGFKKVESMARYNGQAVVGLSLNKVSDGNAVNISRELRKRLDTFRTQLPKGIRLDIATDTTAFIVKETRDTEWSIAIGILLTVIILYLFTGHINLTFIAAIVIPTSIISAFALMSWSGFTINFLTLLAIATALGTLIANAIVIIENVLVHLEHHEDAQQAAIIATKEVAAPVFAATGTNLVVFTPLAMMGGIVGLFMRSFGLTVVYATLFSLLASYTLTPMLCGLMLKKQSVKPEKGKYFNPLLFLTDKITAGVEFLKREYKYLFDLQMRFPKTTIFLVIALVLSTRFILPYIDSDFMPKSDEDKLGFSITMPQGTTIERTFETVRLIEQRLDKIPEKAACLTRIGENGVENAYITMDLVPLAQRTRSDEDILNELIPFVAQIPDAEVHIIRGDTMGGETGDVSIDVYGIDYAKMVDLSQQMKKEMEKSGYFRSVALSYKTPKQEIQFIPEQDKLVRYGVSGNVIGRTLRASIYGNDDNQYKEAGEEYDIHVELNDTYATDFNDIKEISLLTRNGMISVTELGTLKNTKSMPVIFHRDRQRVIQVDGYLAKSSLGYVSEVLNKRFSSIVFENGYGYRFVGDSERQAETGREIGKAFLLAVLLTYMLLAAIMDSFLFPLPIMTTVVTSFVGVFVALFFAGLSMNIASMMSIVMLVGIVVNNAVLMLDYTMMKMREGVPVKEALWLGASVKFRAILMTSIAIILGVLPQLWAVDAAKRSMGVVMAGGIFASIIFTFIFVPVAFWYLDRFVSFLRRVSGKTKTAA